MPEKFYWQATAKPKENIVEIILYREVQEYDQREGGSFTRGQPIARRSFRPEEATKDTIEKWAVKEKSKWLVSNASGVVASTLNGKHYV